ncbi:nuclear transport factor 2 family protein [Mycolicibacterium gilvum]|uniref:nuclear transport factor 2 family protein n=1 Tax=Mycolicibacterium gilvum TaxID=1804 RepID=UPI001F3C0432|nr:nuclear transport factor 2 family protein [Mycolicibacterium gilvum]
MSERDGVELVRRFTTSLASGDLDACIALLDDANVFSESASLPFGGDYVGGQGFRQLLGNVGRDFRVELDPPEIAGANNWVAVVVHGTFTSRRTGRSMPVECVDIYRLSGDKIVRVDVHYKDPGALTELCRESADPSGGSPPSGQLSSNTSQMNRGALT